MHSSTRLPRLADASSLRRRTEPEHGRAVACFPSGTRFEEAKEKRMPILLWVGIPIILLGGGYAIVHFVH